MGQGFTLMEVMVAMGILAMLGLILAGFLIPSLRAWVTGQAQSQVQREAMMVLQRLHEDIRSAHPLSVQCPTSSRVAFLSKRGPLGELVWNAKGQTAWQSWELFYFDAAQGTVQLHVENLADAIYDPTDFNPLGSPAPSDLVVARSVYSLECSCPGNGLLSVQVEARQGTLFTQLKTELQSMIDAP